MPDASNVWRWLDKDPEFASKYARAREVQAEVMDDLILEEAEKATPENAASQRVKIDAYKWRAAKLAPKKYGDRQFREITGEIVVENRQVLAVDELDYEAREKMREALEMVRASRAVNVTPSSND